MTIRYVHGSEDSLDVDVFYVFDEMPSFSQAQEFCADKEENRNIIVVKDGIVTDCYKGTIEEINNGLFYTYQLHEQQYPLIIERPVERDILIKTIRVLRCFLTHCSRTHYRSIVKKAMKSPSWKQRVEVLSQLDLSTIDDYGKHGTKQDVLKVFAFQLSQVLGLYDGFEIYTKSRGAKVFPKLHDYLYRNPTSTDVLQEYLQRFIEKISTMEVVEKEGLCYFNDYNKIFDLVKEQYK